MMTTKNSRFAGTKKLALLPVLAILFVSFTKKDTEQSTVEDTVLKHQKQAVIIPLSETTSTQEEKLMLRDFRNLKHEIQIKMDTVKPRIDDKTSASLPVQSPSSPVRKSLTEETVDVLPLYPGGINEFRILVNRNFNTAVLSGAEGLMRTTVYFTIDENGNVSNIGADGDNAAFNAESARSVKVSNEEKLWTPAKINGQNVPYVFKMPLTMQFAK